MTLIPRGEDGVTAVEFALVVLIILTITMAGIDFGLWMFQKSEAAQAAREASRVAMISPPGVLGAQTSGSIYDASIAEIEADLPDYAVSVSCADSAGSSITDAALCGPGDLITVTVQWHRDPLTFIGFTDTVSGSSTRKVVGLP